MAKTNTVTTSGALKLAGFATESNITLNTLGFGENWNQNILEQIADTAAGTLAYIEEAAQAVSEFGRDLQSNAGSWLDKCLSATRTPAQSPTRRTQTRRSSRARHDRVSCRK